MGNMFCLNHNQFSPLKAWFPPFFVCSAGKKWFCCAVAFPHIAHGVGLTSLIEGQECFRKFGISVRPLAHILDTNREGEEDKRGGWKKRNFITDTWTQKDRSEGKKATPYLIVNSD